MTSGNSFVTQKSHEISLALVKLSIRCRRQDFRQRLEKLAFDLAEATGSGNFESAISVLSAASHMMSLGKSIYEIEPINAMVVNDQISYLLAEARKMAGVIEGLDTDIASIFSRVDSQPIPPPGVVIADKPLANVVSVPKKSRPSRPLNLQPAILSAVRQLGNPAMKDLIAALPNVKERTMRYNLQKMAEAGIILKSGNGPGCRYSATVNIAESSII